MSSIDEHNAFDDFYTDVDLSLERVVADTLLYAGKNNKLALIRLFNETGKYYDSYLTDTFMATLLGHDYIDFALQIVEPKSVESWIDDNIERVIDSCPNVFDQWAQPRAEVVARLSNAFLGLDDASKMALLRGEMTSTPHMRLHQLLRTQPSFWQEVPPEWVGARDCALREAAKDLGWTPNAFIGMARDFFSGLDKHAIAWVNATEYPYSLAMAVAWTSLREPSKLPPGTEKRQVSKAIFSTRCVVQANPLDVALAKIILRVISSNYGLVRDVAATEASEKDVAHLEGVVDMHITLGAMDALMHSLANGRIPGQAKEAAIALPEFDTPENA